MIHDKIPYIIASGYIALEERVKLQYSKNKFDCAQALNAYLKKFGDPAETHPRRARGNLTSPPPPPPYPPEPKGSEAEEYLAIIQTRRILTTAGARL